MTDIINFNEIYDSYVNRITETVKNVSTCQFSINKFNECVTDLKDQITDNREVMLDLNDMFHLEYDTFMHSVNVAVFSLVIGLEMQMGDEELFYLTQGALLHDVGKLGLQHDILNKPGKLTNAEFEHVKMHTLIGYDMLKGIRGLVDSVKEISLDHHERIDGSGYPNKKHGNEVSVFTKIVSIADVFDALTSERCYKEPWSYSMAIQCLLDETPYKLDAFLVNKFLKHVVFQAGTL